MVPRFRVCQATRTDIPGTDGLQGLSVTTVPRSEPQETQRGRPDVGRGASQGGREQKFRQQVETPRDGAISETSGSEGGTGSDLKPRRSAERLRFPRDLWVGPGQ